MIDTCFISGLLTRRRVPSLPRLSTENWRRQNRTASINLIGWGNMDIRYNTSSVERARRFEFWTDIVCRHCIPATCTAPEGESFDGEFSFRSIGPVDIGSISAQRHNWTRDAPQIRQGQEDDLWLGYLLEGQGVLHQEGRDARLSKGSMTLYDAARPFAAFVDAKSAYWLRMPRRSLLQRCPQADRLTALTIDIGQPVSAPLRSMIEYAAVIDFAKMRSGAAAQFGSTLLDLVAVALEFQIPDVEPFVESGLYGRVLAFIERNFEDPGLCLEGIATAHQVSSRTITRAFARRGQTPMSVVWRKRLEASRLSLVEGRSGSVTAAAFDYGFSDLSHFSRAFRKAYGCTPHSLMSR